MGYRLRFDDDYRQASISSEIENCDNSPAANDGEARLRRLSHNDFLGVPCVRDKVDTLQSSSFFVRVNIADLLPRFKEAD